MAWSNIPDNNVQSTSSGYMGQEIEFRVFPNPAKHNLILEFKDRNEKAFINLLNLDGNVLHERIIPKMEQRVKINLSDYQDGIYFIQVRIGEKIHTKKIILSKGFGATL